MWRCKIAIKNGDLVEADSLINNTIGTTFRNTAQLLYNSSLIGYNSKLNVATGVPNLKNIKYDVFNTDTATYFSGMDYNGIDKNYRSQDNTVATDYFIDIHCTSASGSWTTFNCAIKEIKRTSTGRIYRLYCTTGTAAAKRASILATLFKPATIGDATTAKVISQITGLTALKTSDSNDVGYKFSYGYGLWNRPGGDGGGVGSYIATFSNTTDNSATMAWGETAGSYGAIGTISRSGYLGTNSANPFISAGYLSRYLQSYGTNTSASNFNNPTTATLTCSWETYDVGAGTVGLSGLIMYKTGSLSWEESHSGTFSLNTAYNYNFTPVLGLIDYDKDEDTFVEFQTTSLPTIKDCIATWNAEIDGDNTLTVSISADGTNYEEVTDATIHRFTNTGTNLFIKFEIDRVDTSAVDKISEYAILYNCTGAS